MFYLSLVLILSGILLFSYSILSRSFSKPREVSNDSLPGRDDSIDVGNLEDFGEMISGDDENATLHEEFSRDFQSHDDENDDVREVSEFFKDQEFADDNNDENTYVKTEDEAGIVSAAAGENDYEIPVTMSDAVLFDDSSNVIDYDSSTGIIDPSLEKYKSIKRIGSGTFSVEKEGVSFYVDTKLHRLDFYKINRIKTGDNYLALFTGGGSVKLFLFANNSQILDFEEKFEDYLANH